MRWTSVAWACCLLPVLTGCNTMSRVMHGASGASVTNDVGRATDGDARRGALTAWESVRTQHAQRAFSDEFRDGFVDGYADFLARGGESQAPAVPPVPYERYKKYFGRDGHGLVRDYYLGFNYGAEVAVTPGHRPAPATTSASAKLATRPTSALKAPEAGKFAEPKTPSETPALLSLSPEGGKGKGIPPLPKPEVPIIKPFNPDLTGGGKFTPSLVPSDQDRLPVPYPPLPIPAPVLTAPPLDPPTVVPTLTAPERTLSVLDNIPVIPLRYPPPK